MIGRFVRLSAEDRRFPVATLVLPALLRLALSVIPLQMLPESMNRLTAQAITPKRTSENAPVGITGAVSSVVRYFPGPGNCLAEAPEGKKLLDFNGCPAPAMIGVTKDETGGCRAFAWMESREMIRIGGTMDKRSTLFTCFQDLEP